MSINFDKIFGKSIQDMSFVLFNMIGEHDTLHIMVYENIL